MNNFIFDLQLFEGGAANSDDSNTTEDYTILAETFVESLQHKTEAGYPLIAGLFFNPHEYHGFKNLGSSYYADSETLTINSSDGLQLTGYHYTPKNPNDKWVILVHGYGHNHKHMNGFARQYLTNNYHVLMVDQRAAGDSEGEWLTMSAAEGEDVALWTHKIAELNPDAKITLHGISMGAATAMLAAANPDLTNVTSLIEDCGYTRVLDLVNLAKGLIPELEDQKFIKLVNDTSESLTGYPLTAAAPIDSLGNATMPSMFITGTADQVINPAMLKSLYSASGAEVKEIFTVEGATHGLSGLKDSIGYGNAVFRFNAEAAGEGWITSNVTDNISLRGTKYDDTITSSGDYVTIIGGTGDDTITNSGNYVTITGGTGDDTITNSGNYVTITGGTGNDTLVGGAGKGIFVYSAGKDVITDYTAEQDKIKIFETIKKTTYKNEDVIFTIGSGTLTVKNGKGKKISIEDADGETSTKTYPESESETLDTEDPADKAQDEIIKDAPKEMDQTEIDENTDSDSNLNLDSNTEAKNVKIPESVKSVTFGSSGGNVAQFDAGSTKTAKAVTFGTGGDSAIIGKGITAKIDVNLGGGNDRVVNNGTNTFINFGSLTASCMTGRPTFYAGAGSKMSFNGAKAFALGAGLGLGLALASLATSIKTFFASMTNGVLILAKGGQVDFNYTETETASADKLTDNDGTTQGTYNEATFSNVYTEDGTRIISGFTGNKGGTIDMSNSSERFILWGNYKDDKLSSVLKTGANDDYIFAGSGDTVDAGAGTNTVYLNATRKEAADGAVVMMSTNGATTIDDFNYGFKGNNDKINVDNVGEVTFAYNSDGNIEVSGKDSVAKATINIGTAADYKNILVGDNTNAAKITVVNEGAAVGVTGANNYYGSGSVLDLSEFDGTAYVDLSSEGNSTLGEDNVSISGFSQLRAGAGNATLNGSSAKETLTAGTGNGTLWGAGGNDSLVGVSSGKEGTTTFRFVAGDGRDTISGFDVANDTVYTENEISSVSVNGKNVVIGLNGDDKLTVENVSGTDFTVKVGDAEIKAQVGGSNLTYDGYATYYNAQGSRAKLTVSADAGKANVWLNQEVGANYGNTTQFFGEIVEVDGSRSSSSAVLVGSKDIDNKITASKGGSTLWGGGISNDTLIGGNGADSFYYMMGNGNDTVQNARANDQVVLNGIEMSQITSTNVSSGAVVLNFSDGGSLTVNTNGGTTFKLGDESGASYVTDKAGNWTKK